MITKINYHILCFTTFAFGLNYLQPVESKIRFYYYPNADSGVQIDKDYLNKVRFTANTPFFIVIDGFLSNIQASMSQNVKNSLLSSRPNANVILVDWGDLSGSKSLSIQETIQANQLWMAYNTAKSKVPIVGGKVAQFLHKLVKLGFTSYLNIHLIGFSLGAHIAGVAGQLIISKYGSRITRITGLDPAGLGFSMRKPDDRLDKSDAEFVDVYFTNRMVAGDFEHNVGHVDVYINGGASQPGCDFPSLINSTICSHSFSWRVWNKCTIQKCQACLCTGSECESSRYTFCTKTTTVGMGMSLDIILPSITGNYYLTMEPI